MKFIIFRMIIGAVTLGFFHPFDSMCQDIELTIIGNAESAPEEIDMNQLKSILKGEKLRWDDGLSIKIALMKTNTAIGTNTCEKVYNMTPNELNKYFLAMVFQGKVKAPSFFNSTAELENFVSQTPGAIGVVQNSAADQIKIIRVDGKEHI